MIKRLSLTDFVVEKLSHGANIRNIEKQWKEQDIKTKWDESTWAKKIKAKETRASLSDFDRFKVMIAKKQKSMIIKEKLGVK